MREQLPAASLSVDLLSVRSRALMANGKRTARSSGSEIAASASGNDDFPELEVEADPSLDPAPEPVDPARLAARILLEAALKEALTSAAEAGKDGSLCLVLLPDSSWIEVVRDEWRSLVRHGTRYVDAARDYWVENAWVVWAPVQAPNKILLEADADRLGKAVFQNVHCLGLTANLSWLPPDLVDAADHRLTMLPPKADDIAHVAGQLGSTLPGDRLTDGQAALVTPRLLRLARRRGQTSDAYILKLCHLVERSSVPDPVPVGEPAKDAGSPRAAPNLLRLHGMTDAVAWGLDVKRDVTAFLNGNLPWADVDRGCLLSGPPGCGKTLFARSLAASCDLPLICGSYGEWHGSGAAHQGDLLKAMRKTFGTARAEAPCILFIDEVDSFPNRGTITHSFAEWEIQVVNALLSEIDGVEGRDGIVLLAACNYPEKLDPALVRSGRLDRHIRIGLPDRLAVAGILREHLGDDLAGDDLADIAMAASGVSGADCERLVRGARRRARSAGRKMMLEDLMSEVRGKDCRSPSDLWLAAVHEAGHAVAACALRPGAVEMVSLNAVDGSGGQMRAQIVTSAHYSPADVDDQLIVRLAGRAAEHEIFGSPSSGAGGADDCDLATATKIAMISDCAFGFSDGGGLIWRGMPVTHLMARTLAADPPMADRIRRQLDEAYATSRSMIGDRIDAVKALARELMLRRVIDGREAEEIVLRCLDGVRT